MMMKKEIVLAYWNAMQSNDFVSVAEKWLTEDFECHWRQSNEKIVGRDNFIAINQAYPAEGLWEFTLNEIITEGNKVVTDVDVSDGKTRVKAITFHYVTNGKIYRQIEYWVDNYEAPDWRKQWVEQLRDYNE